MITNTSRNILKYILLLSSIKYIDNVRAENQCTSNLQCAKLNTGIDSHVCIRWDGQKDYVCYLEAEAYCDKDITCQGFNKALKFCYVPPWITNKNSQKQCFSIHSEGGTCIEDKHCNKGLVCLNNICTGGTNANANKMDTTTTYTKDNADANGNAKTDNKNTNTNKNSNKNTNSSSSITFDYNDEEEVKKDEPIEIIGLPLWGFITIVTIPVIFIIAIVWCLSIGRRSYREEEEKKRNKMVLKNNKKELDTNYKGATSEKLLAESASSSDYKGEMLKSYVNGDASGAVTSISSSSNSTIANNITVVPGFTSLNNKNSQSSLDVPKLHKKKKSNSNLAATATAAAAENNTTSTTTKTKVSSKSKKPKVAGSEYSESNSHRGLLANGMSATDSGVYSSYFSGAGSTVSSSYFGQPMATTDAMNAYYYQQMIAAQQLQQAQIQNQALMNQYYMENAAAMPTVDMMQYQQLYGAGMMNGAMLNNPMLYAGSDVGSTDSIPRKSKPKHKK